MLRINHFKLKDDLRIAKSSYRHNNPQGYSNYLRKVGYDVTIEACQVIVYHAEETEPDENRKPVTRERLTLSSPPEQYSRGVNALIDAHLRKSGFIRVGPQERREYISPSDHVRSLVIEERGLRLPAVNARAHLRWTWELEWYEGVPWLVPLPGCCFLTAQEPRFPALMRWLRLRLLDGERIKGINLQTGMHSSLVFKNDQWGTLRYEVWEPLDSNDWRVCLDMEAMEELGYSVAAFHSAQFTFDGLLDAIVRSSAFATVLHTAKPHTPAETRIGTVPGEHLHFRKGTARELKAVHPLGVLEPPPNPVRILVAASRKDSDAENHLTRHILGAHLIDRATLNTRRTGQDSLRAVGASDGRDTIATIWTSGKYSRGFGLPPFELATTRLHLYDPRTGDLVANRSLEDECDAAERDGVTLIALVLIDDDMAKPEHDQLMRQFRRMKALPLRASSLSGKNATFPAWVNLTLNLAQKAGAVPWDLAGLPGVDAQTVFVGIDLGHDHARDISQVALTLFDHRGRPLESRVVPCRRNNERIPSDVLYKDLCWLLFERDGPSPTQVIVHRDGRFLAGEVDDLISALQDVPSLSIVSIKKDSCTRLSGMQIEGAFVKLGGKAAVLVTNCQSLQRSMPRPIEIELVYSDHLDLQHVVSQVFWLTRVCQGSAYNPRRLPATTGLANNIAGTGHRVHLKGWEHYEG